MSIDVLIGDDHAIVRQGLVLLLGREPDIRVVGEAADGAEALARARALRAAVAVLDVGMPRMTGIEVTRALRDAGVATAVVLLSMHQDPGFVAAGLDAGALGYVVKAAAGAELVQAVRAAAEGQIFLSPRVSKGLIDRLRADGPPAAGPALASHERDVVRLIAEGLSSKEIAVKLGLEVRAVEKRRARIMQKLNIHTLPGLIKYAIRHHIVALDD